MTVPGSDSIPQNRSPESNRVALWGRLLFYIFYVPTLILCVIYLMTLAWLTPYRARMWAATLWPGFMSGAGLRWSTGIESHVEGLENLADGPVVVVCNHQSEWETMYLAKLLCPSSIVMKKSLLRIPVYGWGMSLTRPIAIDRGSPKASIRAILNQGKKRLEDGSNVLIFPEGTRVQPGSIRKYTRTAFKLAVEAEVPLVPVVHNSGDYWLRRGFKAGTIQAKIGKPIDTKGKTAEAIASEVERWSRQTYADFL